MIFDLASPADFKIPCLNPGKTVQNKNATENSAEQPGRVKLPMSIKRGEIYYADLSPVIGSEQGGIRPVLIVQNDIGNRYSPTVIAAAITSQRDKAKLPTHIEIDAARTGLSKNSVVLLEQIRTIDKKRLKERMGEVDSGIMNRINNALSISFGLPNENTFGGSIT